MLEIFQKFTKLSKLFTKHLESKKQNLTYSRLNSLFYFLLLRVFQIFHSSQNLERDGALHLERLQKNNLFKDRSFSRSGFLKNQDINK